jgi:hypothetical protein
MVLVEARKDEIQCEKESYGEDYGDEREAEKPIDSSASKTGAIAMIPVNFNAQETRAKAALQ